MFGWLPFPTMHPIQRFVKNCFAHRYCLHLPVLCTDGTPLGTRSCFLNGEWMDPIWLSSCGITLEVVLPSSKEDILLNIL